MIQQLPQNNFSTKSRDFLCLLYVTVWTFAVLYAPQPLLSAIHSDYPTLSESTITLLMTVALFPLGIGPLVYGSFLSSISARKVLLVCVTLLSMAEFGLFYCTQFEFMLACRLVQGLLIPAILTCLMAYIGAHSQGAELQRAMAVYIGVSILGGLVGRVLGGIVASVFSGWRYAFLMCSIFLLLALIPLWSMKAEAQTHFVRIRVREFWDILRTKGMPNLLLIDCMGFFVFAALTSVLPFYMQSHWGGFAEWHIALMYLGAGVGVIIAFSAHSIQKFFGGEIRTILAGVCIYCLTMPLFLCPNVWMLFLANCLVCAGQFAEHSTSPGLINRLSTHDKAAVNGLYLSTYYAGGALGSYLPILVYASFGWQAFIGLLTLCLAMLLVVIIHLQRNLPKSALK
ncbi:MAG: MFS transporter [Desulfovibrionaceae bacterium]